MFARNLMLGRRFVNVARDDGLGPALGQTAKYVGRRLKRSPLFRSPDRARGDATYLNGIWRTLAQEDAFHITASPAVINRRRVVAMIGDLNLPQCRKYRVEQLGQFWAQQGVEFDFAHYEDIPRASRIMQHTTHLMEYRLRAGPITDMLRYEARRLRLPILYDIDDPLFSVSAYETYGNMAALPAALKDHFVSEAPGYLTMMNGADAISVSTPGLQRHAALFTKRPIFLRRNFADAETLDMGAAARAARPAGDDLFRVAFASGSQGHEADLATVMDPLVDFLARSPKHRLMILGHFDVTHLPEHLRKRVETHKFSTYAAYLGTLARADCAIMPLSDDAFNSCKSAVRVLDASAVGIPSIVGPVGDFKEVILDGKTGVLAETPDEWAEALQMMSCHPERRRQMGQDARRDLEQRWCAGAATHIASPALLEWVV